MLKILTNRSNRENNMTVADTILYTLLLMSVSLLLWKSFPSLLDYSPFIYFFVGAMFLIALAVSLTWSQEQFSLQTIFQNFQHNNHTLLQALLYEIGILSLWLGLFLVISGLRTISTFYPIFIIFFSLAWLIAWGFKVVNQ